MTPFATVDDVISLFRPLKQDERDRAEELLPVVSNRLRVEADNVGKDIDEMIDKMKYIKMLSGQ